MDELAVHKTQTLAIAELTKDLIVRGVSDNTLGAYRCALKDPDAWTVVEENGFRIDNAGSSERSAGAIGISRQ